MKFAKITFEICNITLYFPVNCSDAKKLHKIHVEGFFFKKIITKSEIFRKFIKTQIKESNFFLAFFSNQRLNV